MDRGRSRDQGSRTCEDRPVGLLITSGGEEGEGSGSHLPEVTRGGPSSGKRRTAGGVSSTGVVYEVVVLFGSQPLTSGAGTHKGDHCPRGARLLGVPFEGLTVFPVTPKDKNQRQQPKID